MHTIFSITVVLLIAITAESLPMKVPPMDLTEDSHTSEPPENDKPENKTSKCSSVHKLDIDDVQLLDKGYIFVKSFNKTLSGSRSDIIGQDDKKVCFDRSASLKEYILENCVKWKYDGDEYTVLKNGSTMLYDELLEPGTYEFKDGQLWICATDYDHLFPNMTLDVLPRRNSDDKSSFLIGKIGSWISILALVAHLVTFCMVPALRNLPGFNLAVLSVAFLFGYSFVLIGQIPEVPGDFCVISAVLQQYFFLVAFFAMNVMAFDIWRTLRLATTNLTMSSENRKKWNFLWYSLHAWSVPLIIMVVDWTKGAPDWAQTRYRMNDRCWLNNSTAQAMFFKALAFCIIVINCIFFILSALIIKQNTMKSTSDQEGQTDRINFVLYIRLTAMMGITWLINVLATIFNLTWMWSVFDVLNSLQGLFLFLLFTCSRKVVNHIRTSDEEGQRERINFVHYIRLAAMMAITWLISVLEAIFHQLRMWRVFDSRASPGPLPLPAPQLLQESFQPHQDENEPPHS